MIIIIFFNFVVKHQKIDMVFAFGAEGDNSLKILAAEKRMAKGIIDSQIEKDVKYSVMKYGNVARIELQFREVSSTDMLKQVIDVISWSGPGLAVDDAVKKAVENLKQNGRPQASRVLVLFVSGKAKPDEKEVERLTELLADAGVHTVLIAINNDDDTKFDKLFPPGKTVIVTDRNVDAKTTVPDVISGISKGKTSENWSRLVVVIIACHSHGHGV